MNKLFKVIWDTQKQMFVVVSELAKSHTKNLRVRNSSGQLNINTILDMKICWSYDSICIRSTMMVLMTLFGTLEPT